jgi:energy-coupling factor transporter ATP-binding protein EcfA2
MPRISQNVRELLRRNFSMPNGHGPKQGEGVPPPTPTEPPELARDDDLIGAIQRDLVTIGIVGERENATLVYLAYTSRLLDYPFSIIARGATGSGKSTLLNLVATLFPPETILHAMKITEAGIFNGPKDYLRHRIIISGERQHSDDDLAIDSNAIVRQLLSERKVTRIKSMPGSNPDGSNFVQIHQVREGPVVWAETTTVDKVFDEDLCRMVQVYMDESEEQTRRVIRATAGRYSPDYQPPDLAAVHTRHHDFQRWLQTSAVVVPFEHVLASGVPTKGTIGRRLIQQVMSVLEASVILHQHKRGRDGQGRLLAELHDYEITRNLLLAPLHAAMGTNKQYADAVMLRAKLTTRTFTSRDVNSVMGYKNKMGASRLLKGLVKSGFLRLVKKGQRNAPAVYEWAEAAESLVLPTVVEVARASGLS